MNEIYVSVEELRVLLRQRACFLKCTWAGCDYILPTDKSVITSLLERLPSV